MRPALALILISGGLGGCHSRPLSVSLPLYAPTKDQVALVDGAPLSITTFQAIRTQVPSASKEEALWLGLAALALEKSAQSKKRGLPLASAFEIALYALSKSPAEKAEQPLKQYFGNALPPLQVHQEIEQLLAHSAVSENQRALAELD